LQKPARALFVALGLLVTIGLMPRGRRASTCRLVFSCLTARWLLVSSAGACDFKRIDAAKLASKGYSVQRFKRPVLLKNAFQWQPELASQAAFREAFGNLTIQLTSDPEAQSRTGVAPLRVQKSVDNWIEQLSGDAPQPYVFMFCQNGTQWLDRIRRSYEIPKVLREVAWQFFVSGGAESQGFALHQHQQETSWVAAIAGAKDWYVFPPDKVPFEPGFYKEERQMMSAPHVQYCRQKAGDVVFLPIGWWHATANRGEWSWAFGAQGHSEGVLFDAVIGDVDALARSPDKLKANSQGKRPIHGAAWGGHAAAAELLLEAGERVDRPGPSRRQPLHHSAEMGHSAVTRLLLQRGAEVDPDVGEGVMSPLGCAAMNGHSGVAEVLLRAGASVTDHAPNAALHIAVDYGHMAASEALLANGVAADTSLEGLQPVHVASQRGHLDLLKLLLQHGASIEAADTGRRVMEPGARPLHYAAYHGHLPLVKFLLKAGASRDVATKSGYRALDLSRQGPSPSKEIQSTLTSKRDGIDL